VTVVLIAVCFLLLYAAQVAVWWWSNRSLRGRMRADIIVTLKAGQSFAGVLFETDRRLIVLRDATELQVQATVPVDGELIVRWDDVAYIQKP
jgi:small nuclear ribonucleoprotein (snRNP)-like protein